MLSQYAVVMFFDMHFWNKNYLPKIPHIPIKTVQNVCLPSIGLRNVNNIQMQYSTCKYNTHTKICEKQKKNYINYHSNQTYAYVYDNILR